MQGLHNDFVFERVSRGQNVIPFIILEAYAGMKSSSSHFGYRMTEI